MIKPQKKFNSQDYQKNFLAYENLKKHFKFLYPHLREEDYSIDVSVYNGEKAFQKKLEPICYLELESKSLWKGHDFPDYFKDVQFLAKKQKYLKLNKPVYWILFNDDCTNAAIINLRKIVLCDLDVIECRNGIGTDYFYRIPKNEFIWGIENIERFIIHEGMSALNKLHNIQND